MKSVKTEDKLLKKIIVGELSLLVIANDQQYLSLDDKLEFLNKSDKAVGEAVVEEVRIRHPEGLENIDPDVREQVAALSVEDTGPESEIKIVRFKFKPYDKPIKKTKENNDEYESLKLFTDGGSRGNPGPSASGYVLLTTDDEVIKGVGVYLGITTNNQAEYKSLKFGLEDARNLGAKEVDVFMDSQLVINQMNGIYKIKNKDLIPIYRDIKVLQDEFERITYTHVPREFNKLADAEVNKALDAEAA